MDVKNIQEGERLARETGADGVMYGRAIFGNPWFFSKEITRDDLTLVERLRVLEEHTKAFERYYSQGKNFATMKKHFKAYVEGFSQAKVLREKLMKTVNASEVSSVLNTFIGTLT